MNWIMRRLEGKPLVLRLAALTAVALVLIAVTLLLPFARGTRYAPRAIADEGGYILLAPLAAGSKEPDAAFTQKVEKWQSRADAARQRQQLQPITVATEVVIDEFGHMVVQVALAGATSEEATALAEELGTTVGQPAPRVIAVAPGDKDALLPVRPLDDPENPYRGQYTDLDRWIYEHAWSYDELVAFREKCFAAQAARKAGQTSTPEPDIRFMGALVEESGWMRPTAVPLNPEPVVPAGASLYDRDNLERKFGAEHFAEFRRKEASGKSTQGSWVFTGPGSDRLYREYKLAQEFPDLARTPRVPQWLADNPPFTAIFVPNGEVVTYGKPEEKAEVQSDPATKSFMFPDLGWYRYSKDGKLLQTEYLPAWGSRTEAWTYFYWPRAESATKDDFLMDQFFPARRGGSYWVKLTPPTKKEDGGNDHAARVPVAAFRYDGTPLDLNQPVPPELLIRNIVEGHRLKDLRAAQDEYGIWFGHDGKGDGE